MVKELPVVYLQTAACSGCAVSLLNSASPTIKNVLIDQIVPGVHINLRFHPVVMGAAGDMALKVLEDTASQQKGEYVLVVDGAVPTADGGVYGAVGERNGKPVTMHAAGHRSWPGTPWRSSPWAPAPRSAAYRRRRLTRPAASRCERPSRRRAISKPLINIPGCPPHPDWFVGTVAGVILSGLPKAEDLDDFLRPKAFYGKLIHENCPRRASFDEGKFAKKFGDEGCLYELGCKGPITYADCPIRKWNSGTNWVIGCRGALQRMHPARVPRPGLSLLREAGRR